MPSTDSTQAKKLIKVKLIDVVEKGFKLGIKLYANPKVVVEIKNIL